MKRIVSCVFALSALLTAVSSNVGQAADLHGMVYKAPPPPPAPILTWTGCYVGANVGGAVNQTSTNQIGFSDGTVISPPDDFGGQNASSVIGGAQIGCDYQFDGPWVTGLRGQFDYGNLSGQDTLPAFPTFYMNDKIHDIATATGRLGYAMAPGWLAYVQGGGAWTRDDLQIYGSGPPAFLSESGTANRYGYDVGAGVADDRVPLRLGGLDLGEGFGAQGPRQEDHAVVIERAGRRGPVAGRQGAEGHAERG